MLLLLFLHSFNIIFDYALFMLHSVAFYGTWKRQSFVHIFKLPQRSAFAELLLPQNHCHSSTIKRPETIAKASTHVTTRKGESKVNTSLDKKKSMFLTIDDHFDCGDNRPSLSKKYIKTF